MFDAPRLHKLIVICGRGQIVDQAVRLADGSPVPSPEALSVLRDHLPLMLDVTTNVVQVFGAVQIRHGYVFANARPSRIKRLVHDGF